MEFMFSNDAGKQRWGHDSYNFQELLEKIISRLLVNECL